MYHRVRLVSVGLLSVALFCGATSTTQGATVSSISFLDLASGGFFQEPANVVQTASIKHLPGTANVSGGARGNRGDRDLAQSFTVSGTDFPTGLDINGIVIYYEAAPATPLGTFNVELFPIASATPATLASSADVSGSLLVSATGLEMATSFLDGTAVFNFDTSVHLDVGSYAWRLVIPGEGTTNIFAWGPTTTTNTYAGGAKYEGSAGVGTQALGSGDFYFGVIQVPVPEPSSYILACMGLLGLGFVRMRNRSKRA